MTYRNCTRILLAGAALGLAACGGGGGGGGLNSTPPPPPTPPPVAPAAVTIIEKATTSQEFAVKGATGTSIAATDQLRIRYDAVAKAYEVQLPSSGTWERLVPDPTSPQSTTAFRTPSMRELNVVEGIAAGYDYSALAYWAAPPTVGAVAFGIPTPAGGVPTTGSATFNGTIFGQTNEAVPEGLIIGSDKAIVSGKITLGFNFGAGTLSGSMSPILLLDDWYSLPSMQFTNTVYSTGSTTFSGQFDTTLPGMNSFSGLFTGPAAQELIGSFAFPYRSPADNKSYQAAGAFVGKQ